MLFPVQHPLLPLHIPFTRHSQLQVLTRVVLIKVIRASGASRTLQSKRKNANSQPKSSYLEKW